MNERKPEESLKIENIVASAKVTDSLDLPSLASQLKDAEYNKKRFPGVVLRLRLRQGRPDRCEEHRQPLAGPADPRRAPAGTRYRYPRT